MALIKWPTELAEMIVAKLGQAADDDLIVVEDIALNAEDIYYGDRTTFPRLPAVAVEVVDRKNLDTRYSTRTVYGFVAYIMVYFGQYKEAELNRRQSDLFGQKVVEILNSDPNWRDEVNQPRLIAGWVTRQEPGYARRGSTIYATRITWEGKSQAGL